MKIILNHILIIYSNSIIVEILSYVIVQSKAPVLSKSLFTEQHLGRALSRSTPHLYKRKNGNSNMFCKFQHHSMQIFFKMANYFFLKTEKVATTPPHPLTLTAYPTPGKVVPILFPENDRKGCK